MTCSCTSVIRQTSGSPRLPEAPGAGRQSLASSRRRLILDSAALGLSVSIYGFIFGLSAHSVGLSTFQAVFMSAVVFGGASQFAALASIAGGLGMWAIVAMTGFLNGRNVIYSAALAPWLAGRPLWKRALMAHFITDEVFALTIGHFRRARISDEAGYWGVSIGATFLPWILATYAGTLAEGALPDPSRLGLDVLFPAAMAGIAVTLTADRPALLAVLIGAPGAVAISLAWGIPLGVALGPLAGAAVALAAYRPHARRAASLP